jgi:hypothetical protein
VVSVLVTGPKGRGLKPGCGHGFLRVIKIRSTPSFGWEVKPEVPCRKILRHVKDPLRYFRYSNRQYFSVISVFINCTVALQALTLLLRIRNVTVSYLGKGTGYPPDKCHDSASN